MIRPAGTEHRKECSVRGRGMLRLVSKVQGSSIEKMDVIQPVGTYPQAPKWVDGAPYAKF